MNEKKPEIKYSDSVKEIMGNPPGRIVRYGTGVFCSVFLLLILIAWLIRYPDIVPAQIEITTSNPPVTLVTKVTGNIRNLYVTDKKGVKAGDLLAVMETAASPDEVRRVKQIMDTINTPSDLTTASLPDFPHLGEIQEDYSTFIKVLSDLKNYIRIDYYGKKIESLSSEINGIDKYIDQISVKERLYSDNQIIEVKKFRRDSSLFEGKVIPESDLERSHQALLRLNIELQQVRLDHSEKLIELAEKQQLLQDYRIKQIDEKEQLVTLLNESFTNLRAKIKLWETNYLLISPIDGVISFTKFWTVNQTVIKDEPVMTVVPFSTGNYIGRVNLMMLRSGKVKTGQLVNIKLSGYPYLEYGMIRGVVKSKSMVPSKDAYVIEISLPDGLTTLYGTKLEFTQNMQGTAEIITEDLRLIEKIINPFRYAISRNRR
jgi:multidrug resistance efflux pump